MATQGHKDRLTAIDASFLHQEKQASHMHVGALVIFEGPPPAREDFSRTLESRLPLVPRYRQKLAFPRFEMGRPFWVDDPSFNLDYHVRHTALPQPGSDEQLRELVGRIFSQRLDRSKPLWELWIIQGLERDRFALISKTHHALVDGVPGVDIATVLFDLSPVPGEPPEDDGWTPQPEPSDAELVAEGVKGLVRTPFELAGQAVGAAQRPGRALGQVREAAEGVGEVVWAGLNPAPDVPLNVQIGPHRRVLVGAEPAGGLQGDQGRARRDRQRRRARGRVGRARRAGCATAGCAPRGSSCARSCRSRSAPRTSTARSATGSPRCAARCPSTCDDPVERLAIVREGDGPPEGVEAGARRRGDRRASRTSRRPRCSPRPRGSTSPPACST